MNQLLLKVTLILDSRRNWKMVHKRRFVWIEKMCSYT